MAPLTPGKLFLAEQRGRLETAAFRRLSTFQFGPYVHEHKQPFGRLLAFNEETLAGGQTISLPVTDACQLLILPITGAVWADTKREPAALVDVEQLYVVSAAAGSTVHLTNFYEAELSSFLHIWVLDQVETMTAQLFAFELASQPNQLVTATPVPPAAAPSRWPVRVQVGQFAGRAETTCRLPEDTALFAFVLAGAFELQGRLLHAGDGLALWDTSTVELEALSQEAVVITLTLAALAAQTPGK